MSNERTMTCIVCPKGCSLTVMFEESLDHTIIIQSVTGFSCPKGKLYAEQELINPLRTLTTTIKTKNFAQKRLAVRSDTEIPLKELRPVIRYLRTIVIEKPVSVGTCIIKDPLGIHTNIIATDELS